MSKSGAASTSLGLTLIDAAAQLTTQTWNTENRLTKVENPDGSVKEISYGADGHRRKKKSRR